MSHPHENEVTIIVAASPGMAVPPLFGAEATLEMDLITNTKFMWYVLTGMQDY